MTINRVLRIAFGWLLACSALIGISVQAQPYPNKPIRIVVPYPPGGTSDILARALGQKLTDALGQPVVVENKPGANGNLGADLVAKSPPDGYTLLLADIGAIAISPSLYKLPFDPVTDFAPVTMVAYSPHILVVHPSVPVSNTKELITLAKSKPGKLNFAASSVGSAPHLAGIEFASRAGVDWAYIPYKGGAQAITDMAGGQADVMFNGMLATYPHVKSGKLKILAVSSGKRMSAIPDVPTVAESAGLTGFQTGSWQGILAPLNTPKDIISRLSSEVTKILNTPEMTERLAVQGAEVSTNTPEQFTTFIRDEKARWAQVVKAANLKLE
ncbi:MAG: tripartite tricarboxylate transporter substrate binding protein [Burkholderiaceae bacterium]|nr:tripartite tricarboxylate transporter substrate binding protein [Burkholderiaceae bacterium]